MTSQGFGTRRMLRKMEQDTARTAQKAQKEPKGRRARRKRKARAKDVTRRRDALELLFQLHEQF